MSGSSSPEPGQAFPKFKTPSQGQRKTPVYPVIPLNMKKKSLAARTAQRDRKYKSNSTASLYINSTITSPDVNELVRCMALAVLYHIEGGHKLPEDERKFFDIFDEEKFPITRNTPDLFKVPTVDNIYSFINAIFKAERLSAECGVMCMAYIERMISLTGVTMHASNWRRVVLSALILASKVWEDQAVWNVDFLSVFPCVTVKDLGQLEKTVLNMIQFNVSLNASMYAKYYFELRSLAEQDDRNFPLNPLNKDGASRLEERSESEEAKAKREAGVTRTKRSKSVDGMKNNPLSPRVVLS